MSTHPTHHIIVFVGLAGSGKSSAVDYLTAKGYPKVYFGGIVYKEMKKAGITPGDWGPERQFREDLRAQHGKGVIAKFVAKETHDLIAAGQHHIVFDGLYSWSEYKVLKHEFPGAITVVAVVTPKHLRYQRMANRPERPMQPSEVDERDWSEIENLEKGGPIAIADYFIHNNKDLSHLHRQLDEVLVHCKFAG
ncbi:dephospho-CoA kinase [Candidatus Saccharibacteria bacterium]|nr:MAG: dephospho-CoA kinase [Candidatus Saccharibacteria bacterium]